MLPSSTTDEKTPQLELKTTTESLQNATFNAFSSSGSGNAAIGDDGEFYSNFDFLYFPFLFYIDDEKNPNIELIQDFLFDFLKKFKFITYYFVNISKLNNYLESETIKPYKSFPLSTIDIFICVESNFLIIEQISAYVIFTIIENLKDHQISMINASIFYQNIEESNIKEEIKSFLSFFIDEFTILCI